MRDSSCKDENESLKGAWGLLSKQLEDNKTTLKLLKKDWTSLPKGLLNKQERIKNAIYCQLGNVWVLPFEDKEFWNFKLCTPQENNIIKKKIEVTTALDEQMVGGEERLTINKKFVNEEELKLIFDIKDGIVNFAKGKWKISLENETWVLTGFKEKRIVFTKSLGPKKKIKSEEQSQFQDHKKRLNTLEKIEKMDTKSVNVENKMKMSSSSDEEKDKEKVYATSESEFTNEIKTNKAIEGKAIKGNFKSSTQEKLNEIDKKSKEIFSDARIALGATDAMIKSLGSNETLQNSVFIQFLKETVEWKHVMTDSLEKIVRENKELKNAAYQGKQERITLALKCKKLEEDNINVTKVVNNMNKKLDEAGINNILQRLNDMIAEVSEQHKKLENMINVNKINLGSNQNTQNQVQVEKVYIKKENQLVNKIKKKNIEKLKKEGKYISDKEWYKKSYWDRIKERFVFSDTHQCLSPFQENKLTENERKAFHKLKKEWIEKRVNEIEKDSEEWKRFMEYRHKGIFGVGRNKKIWYNLDQLYEDDENYSDKFIYKGESYRWISYNDRFKKGFARKMATHRFSIKIWEKNKKQLEKLNNNVNNNNNVNKLKDGNKPKEKNNNGEDKKMDEENVNF